MRALETILVDKGYVETAALDRIVELYETKIGPHIGAQVMAKAWSDRSFRQLLFEDATKAVSTLAQVGRVGEHLVAVENTPQVHNMVVCTLCSCYPTDVLGLPTHAPAGDATYPGRYLPISVLCSPLLLISEYGIQPPRHASSWCRCVRPKLTAGARPSSRRW